MESCNEFITRYKQSHSSGDDKSKSLLPMISSACPGIHLYNSVCDQVTGSHHADVVYWSVN